MRLLVAVSLVGTVAGDTMRMKIQADEGQPELCLSLYDHSRHLLGTPLLSREEAPIVAWRCDLVDTYHDLGDLWRLDGQGLLLSGLSGKCLSHDPTVSQTSCGVSSSRWKHEADGTLKLVNGGQCLSTGSSISHNGDTLGYSMVLQPCVSSVSWVQEASTLVVYPAPDEDLLAYQSPHYLVSVKQGTNTHQCFVYYTEPQQGEPLQGLSNSYVTFSFSGTVTVTVTNLAGQFRSATLRPLQLGLVPTTVNATTISFELTTVDAKVSVEFDDLWTRHSMLIFADPLETNVPSPVDDGVFYYGVGEFWDNLYLESGATVYLAGGAILYADHAKRNIIDSGTDSTVRNITVRGRGVVSGKLARGAPFMLTLCGSDHTVEGITLVAPPQQSILQINAPWTCDAGWQGTANGAVVRGTKLMGWNYADGIYAGRNSHVSHVFTKVNDDGVKPFETNSLFEHLVQWQQGNGWAIMFAWLTEGQQSNLVVRDSTIIHDLHDTDWSVSGCDPCMPNQASIGIVQGGSGSLTDVVVENVVMETQVWRPFWFGIEKSTWGTRGTGMAKNITLTNVHVMGGGKNHSQVVGTPSTDQLDFVRLVNFRLGSVVAYSPEDAHLDVTNVPDVSVSTGFSVI